MLIQINKWIANGQERKGSSYTKHQLIKMEIKTAAFVSGGSHGRILKLVDADLIEGVTGRKARGLQWRVQVSDIFLSLKQQEETN